MATAADARRIAMALPGTRDGGSRGFGFSTLVKGKEKVFAWSWKERVDPKKPRVENRKVLAVRVANLGEKDLIISSAPEKFFTEPHYTGFPAILVRLGAVTVSELKVLLAEAHRCVAEGSNAKRTAKSRR